MCFPFQEVVLSLKDATALHGGSGGARDDERLDDFGRYLRKITIY